MSTGLLHHFRRVNGTSSGSYLGRRFGIKGVNSFLTRVNLEIPEGLDFKNLRYSVSSSVCGPWRPRTQTRLDLQMTKTRDKSTPRGPPRRNCQVGRFRLVLRETDETKRRETERSI